MAMVSEIEVFLTDRKITVHHNNGRFNGELPRREWTNSPLRYGYGF